MPEGSSAMVDGSSRASAAPPPEGSEASEPTPSTDRDPAERLARLAELAEGVEAPALARAARQWSQRVAHGLFYVACVGQFKRGKSTLLNALIGRDVLPTGIVPVTAVVTLLRHAARVGARVWFADDRAVDIPPSSLGDYVTEAGNPGNGKSVSLVEVFVPSPLLASGMCLVDTPGLGSVFVASDERTREFVPHIDAALVVLGADPPISAEELALVRQLAVHVRDFVFVLSKSDRLTEGERRDAQSFSERVLTEALGWPVGQLLEVSAAEQLRGRGDERDWPGLVEALRSLASGSGSALLRGAAERGVARLVEQLRSEIALRRQMLTEPVEASERRMAELEDCSTRVEGSLQDLGYLLQGEQDRIARELADHRRRFLAEAVPAAQGTLVERTAASTASRFRLRADAVQAAAQIGRATLARWRETEEPVVENLYRRAGTRFVELAQRCVEQLASLDPDLERLPEPVGTEPRLGRQGGGYYFQVLDWLARPSPWDRVIDLVGPRSVQRRRLEHAMKKYLERLFAMTATRIQNDFEARVLESRRRLEAELRAGFEELQRSAERALARARSLRAEGGAAVEAELDRLARAEEELDRIAGRAPPRT